MGTAVDTVGRWRRISTGTTWFARFDGKLFIVLGAWLHGRVEMGDATKHLVGVQRIRAAEHAVAVLN